MSYINDGAANEAIGALCKLIERNDSIAPENYQKFPVKYGLRNPDGTGVVAGLTKVCSVSGYYIEDDERIPKEGQLTYRGVNIYDIVRGCRDEDRFGFEEVAWLLIFGSLPTAEMLGSFRTLLGSMRELPDDFIEDMIMKAPSPNVMNKLARSVLALYSYDDDPDDTSLANILSQSLALLAKMPTIMSCAYQVKRRHYYHKSMYLHPVKPEQTAAQSILNSIRSNKNFTDAEAKLLDLCMMLHAEHGGGNNSTFTVRSLTSTGTDTYSAISGGIGALKGPRHGGANIKVAEMVSMLRENVRDIHDDGQVADYIAKLVRREAGDRSGLVYGMGHAVYTLSDPRAVILKREARAFAEASDSIEAIEDLEILEKIERLTPEIFAEVKHSNKKMCANVDLYSGLIYKMLRIPEDLYTPLFVCARTAGWTAHRIEEFMTGRRIVRPAYKSLSLPISYVPLERRTEDYMALAGRKYIPKDER
ncbi:MAG: citrate synthase [Clostridia bacterium]|nr:citrate synthase [Clostridia bacterium]